MTEETENKLQEEQVQEQVGNTVTDSDNMKKTSSEAQSDEIHDDTTSSGQGKDTAETPNKTITVEQTPDKAQKALHVNEAPNPQATPNANTATVNRKDVDDELNAEDPKDDQFNGGDVIEYMWQHWLIDGAMWCDKKLRKYGSKYFWRLYAKTKDRKNAPETQPTELVTNKKAAQIKNIHEQRHKAAIERHTRNSEEIKNIAGAIADGSLVDNKELFAKYKGMINADSREGKEQLKLVYSACSQLKQKANAHTSEEKIELQKAKANSVKAAATFYTQAIVNETYDTMSRINANDITAAEMLNKIATNKDTYKDIDRSYEQIITSKETDILQATAEERRASLNSPKLTIGDSAKLTKKKMFTRINREWNKTKTPQLDRLSKSSEEALVDSDINISTGRIVENGKTPKLNKHLTEYNNIINEQLHRPQALTEKEPTVKIPAQTLYEAAVSDQHADSTQASNPGQELSNRDEAHKAREQSLLRHPAFRNFYGHELPKQEEKAVHRETTVRTGKGSEGR